VVAALVITNIRPLWAHFCAIGICRPPPVIFEINIQRFAAVFVKHINIFEIAYKLTGPSPRGSALHEVVDVFSPKVQDVHVQRALWRDYISRYPCADTTRWLRSQMYEVVTRRNSWCSHEINMQVKSRSGARIVKVYNQTGNLVGFIPFPIGDETTIRLPDYDIRPLPDTKLLLRYLRLLIRDYPQSPSKYCNNSGSDRCDKVA